MSPFELRGPADEDGYERDRASPPVLFVGAALVRVPSIDGARTRTRDTLYQGGRSRIAMDFGLVTKRANRAAVSHFS